MKVTQDDVQRRIESFEQVCHSRGAKLTHQRLEIFREVLESGDHPDAERVFHGVRRRMPTVSLDTVYRTLWWLRDLGLVTTLGLSRERARFDANLGRHHHFVCTRCGLTRDIHSDAFDSLDLPDSVKTLGHAESIQVEVRGLCIQCAACDDPGAKKQGRGKDL